MYLVMIQHPSGIGIAAIAVQQVLGKAQIELRRGVFTGMDRGHDKQDRLWPGDSTIGDLEHPDVGAVAPAQCGFLPTVTNIDDAGQIGMLRRQLIDPCVGFGHRAIARVARNTRLLARQHGRLVLQGFGS